MKTRFAIILLVALLLAGCSATIGPVQAAATLHGGWLSVLITAGADPIVDQVACLPGCETYPVP